MNATAAVIDGLKPLAVSDRPHDLSDEQAMACAGEWLAVKITEALSADYNDVWRTLTHLPDGMGVRTPGMSPSTSDEQVFGKVEGIPAYRRAKGDRNLLVTARLTRFLMKILRNPDLTTLDLARVDAQYWVDSIPDPATATDDQLLAFVAEYPHRLGESMKRLLHFSMIAAGPRALLDKIADRPEMPAGLANRLVSGIDDVDSACIAQEQWALGRVVARDTALTAMFDEGLDAVGELIGATALDAPLRRFLDRFGHRGNDEYELAAPAWVMDPRPVLAAIDRLRHVPDDRAPDLAMARLAADRAAAELETRKLLRRPLGGLALRAAAVSRAGSVGRERAKDILVLENLGVRRALHELVRRAAEHGGPADPRLAFCVTIERTPQLHRRPCIVQGPHRPAGRLGALSQRS